MTDRGAIIIEGHVQGLSNTRALGSAGIPVYVVDTGKCIAEKSKYCTKSFRCPPYNSSSFADFLVELARKENIQNWLLLPSNDHAVLTIAQNREILSRFYHIVTPEYGILKNIYDKSRLLAIAEEAGLAIPETFYFDDAEPDNPSLPYPLITKGKEGLNFYKHTGKKAFISSDISDLKDNLAEIAGRIPVKDTITQKIIRFDGSNRTISFTAFCIDGEIKTCWTGIKIREHPIRFGTATFACSISSDIVLDQARSLMQKLRYSGVCEIEFLKDPDDSSYKLIEINARTWLWVGLARRCGIDFARICYDSFGEAKALYPEEYAIDIKWFNPFTDIPFSIMAILKRKLKISEFLNSFRGTVINGIYEKRDPQPFFRYILLGFKILKIR